VLRPGGLLASVPTGSWPGYAEEAAAAGVRATSFKVVPDGVAALAALAADPAANLSELFRDLLLSGAFTRIETGAPK
jgi:hypothetical protein